jgi:hypothetical protein
MNTRFFVIPLLVLLLRGSDLCACSGDEYWENEPKDSVVWTSRDELGVQNESKVNDTLLRAALTKAGLVPCPVTEKDLKNADVQMAVRTKASPIEKQLGYESYAEVTQILIRYHKDPKNPQAAATLEVMTRTKVRFTHDGPFFRAKPQYLANAERLGKRVSDNLNLLLSR